MKLEKKYRPELICSRDKTRPAIQQAYATKYGGKPVMVATDGRRMLVVPISVDSDEEYGVIPRDAVKFARSSLMDRKSTCVYFSANGNITFPNGWTMPRDKQMEFPNNWEQVLPSPRPASVSFNAKMLYELVQAMGCETVTLHIGAPSDPITVKPTENNEAFGVLMPVRQV